MLSLALGRPGVFQARRFVHAHVGWGSQVGAVHLTRPEGMSAVPGKISRPTAHRLPDGVDREGFLSRHVSMAAGGCCLRCPPPVQP